MVVLYIYIYMYIKYIFSAASACTVHENIIHISTHTHTVSVLNDRTNLKCSFLVTVSFLFSFFFFGFQTCEDISENGFERCVCFFVFFLVLSAEK